MLYSRLASLLAELHERRPVNLRLRAPSRIRLPAKKNGPGRENGPKGEALLIDAADPFPFAAEHLGSSRTY
jgi:hypothetical protein